MTTRARREVRTRHEISVISVPPCVCVTVRVPSAPCIAPCVPWRVLAGWGPWPRAPNENMRRARMPANVRGQSRHVRRPPRARSGIGSSVGPLNKILHPSRQRLQFADVLCSLRYSVWSTNGRDRVLGRSRAAISSTRSLNLRANPPAARKDGRARPSAHAERDGARKRRRHGREVPTRLAERLRHALRASEPHTALAGSPLATGVLLLQHE